MDWPADKVERRSTESLVPYARNARTHDAAQVAQIAASIREWGWTTPVLIDEAGGIIAGHGRVLAALQLGLPDVPCVVAVGWTEAQRRAYVIADNKLALNAGWDDVLLRIELDDLSIAGFDLSLTGFDGDELALIMDDEAAGGAGSGGSGAGNLAARFGLPPFTILNAREGWWQDRKQAWLAIGIRSELGRGEGDRACPGGSPMPGQGSRAGYQLGAAQADARSITDGAVIGRGGMADQVAASMNTKRKAKADAGNPPSLGAVRGNVLTPDREEGPYSRRKGKAKADG